MIEQQAEFVELSRAQRAALRHVEEMACLRQADARDRLMTILRSARCKDEMFEAAMRSIRAHAKVALHFHPDRFGLKPMSVAESLLKDGHYRNQFETGLSSGSRTAFPGGERDEWEKDLFGSAYHGAEVVVGERPKYGALELIRHPDGPTPRFGSCYFVLRASVSRRTSFTFAGSEHSLAVERLGTIDKMDCVMAALLTEVASGKGATLPWPPFVAPTLGVENLTVSRLLEYVCRELPSDPPDPSAGQAGRVLDTCVEAQVHGRIDLQRDVDRLVIDPAFKGTPTGEILSEVCRRYEIPSQWHCGFQLPVQAVPDDFRGPAMPRLARRIAGDGMLDAAVIGAAESTLYSQPERWADWGCREETLQHLKQLWHVLVHYGAPARRPAA
jgi:Protein of unknown function (DUF3626)